MYTFSYMTSPVFNLTSDDRLQIERTSKMVNVLEEVALNYQIVL